MCTQHRGAQGRCKNWRVQSKYLTDIAVKGSTWHRGEVWKGCPGVRGFSLNGSFTLINHQLINLHSVWHTSTLLFLPQMERPKWFCTRRYAIFSVFCYTSIHSANWMQFIQGWSDAALHANAAFHHLNVQLRHFWVHQNRGTVAARLVFQNIRVGNNGSRGWVATWSSSW